MRRLRQALFTGNSGLRQWESNTDCSGGAGSIGPSSLAAERILHTDASLHTTVLWQRRITGEYSETIIADVKQRAARHSAAPDATCPWLCQVGGLCSPSVAGECPREAAGHLPFLCPIGLFAKCFR